MGRRTILLVVAALIAALGSAMVYLYVRSADTRALAKYEPVQVLTAVSQINTGESLGSAQASGKLQLTEVPRSQVLPGALQTVGDLGDEVALVTIYPQEQIVTAKFGKAAVQQPFTLPDGMIAVTTTVSDVGRVAGFVKPGSHVAIFLTSPAAANGTNGTRVLLPDVQIVSIGTTTVSAQQQAASSGTAAPATTSSLVTFAVNQVDAQKIIYASQSGNLAFGLLYDNSKINKKLPATTDKNLFK